MEMKGPQNWRRVWYKTSKLFESRFYKIKKGLIFIILKILCNVRFRIDRKTQKYTRSENKGGEAIENSKL